MPPKSQATAKKATAATDAPDAIALLKEDHRKVEELFAEFEAVDTPARKRSVAQQICAALKVHTTIEEEIFYPACREGGVEDDLMDEAAVEHESATRLIEQIDAGKPSDDRWEAKVSVLSEQIRHHVHEEEKRGGVFTKARAADLDLEELGAKMARRAAELEKSK